MYFEIPWFSFPDKATREKLDEIIKNQTVLLELYRSIQIQVDQLHKKSPVTQQQLDNWTSKAKEIHAKLEILTEKGGN